MEKDDSTLEKIMKKMEEFLLNNPAPSVYVPPIVDSVDSSFNKNNRSYSGVPMKGVKEVYEKWVKDLKAKGNPPQFVVHKSPYPHSQSYVIGKTAQPLGQMNQGYVYAPYIPLITSPVTPIKTFYDIETHTAYDLPVWIGEVREGGFHEIIRAVYNTQTNTTNANYDAVDQGKSFGNVKKAFSEFTAKHYAKEVILTLCDGTDSDAVFVKCIFGGIDFLDCRADKTEWTTPVRIKLAIPTSQVSVRKHRITYGGHFYATGYADISDTVRLNERIEKTDMGDYTVAEVTLFEPGVDKATIASMEVTGLFWVDYKNKKSPNGEKLL